MISTTYLGMKLSSPVIVGASPLADDVDRAQRLADAGAGALVVRSLFEEDIAAAQRQAEQEGHGPGGVLPAAGAAHGRTLEAYIEKIGRLKDALHIPVIASINGNTLGEWLRYADMLEQAEADAIELNVYHVATDADEDPRDVEKRYLEIVEAVAKRTMVPLAVKLSPFLSAPVFTAKQLIQAGARGVVVFNRFFQPDIDVETREPVPALFSSDAGVLPLRLRWLAAMHGRVGGSLAATGGVRTAIDVVKATMAGADAVQMVSTVLHRGPQSIQETLRGVFEWMDAHGVEDLDSIRGVASLQNVADPTALARANYVSAIQTLARNH